MFLPGVNKKAQCSIGIYAWSEDLPASADDGYVFGVLLVGISVLLLDWFHIRGTLP